jgi:hypothetical protein
MDDYPDDLCRLIIKNMDIVEEAPKIAPSIEKRLFEAINKRIETRVKAEGEWTGLYDAAVGKTEETSFQPNNWLIYNYDKGGESWWPVYYGLWPSNEKIGWLSNAVGMGGSRLNFFFFMENSFGGALPKSDRAKKRVGEFLQENRDLTEAGFSQETYGKRYEEIFLPFSLDQEALCAEYPEFSHSLSRLDEALNTVFEFHPKFDAFVKREQEMENKD